MKNLNAKRCEKDITLLDLQKQGCMFYNQYTDTYYCDIEKVHIIGDEIFKYLEKEFNK